MNLDFNWHILPVTPPHLQHQVMLKTWKWRPATRTSFAATVPANLAATPGWKTVTAGTDVFHSRLGFAWYDITLPALAGPHRVVRFQSVDDNGAVYLNGKRLTVHHGWNSPFTVNLDSYWHNSGRNILTVLVQNTAGPGGLMGAVFMGNFNPVTTASGVPELNSHWRNVRIPNDFIVRGKFSRNADAGHGYLPVHPAWYERSFSVPASDQGKMLWLYFEGVYRDAHVYVNGQFVGQHVGGYTGFRFNIAKYVHFHKPNTLAVYVDPTFFEGWWYEGGGIDRNVWLIATHKLHIARFGTYVISNVPGTIHYGSSTGDHADAQLTIQTTVDNARAHNAIFTIISTIYNPAGKAVGTIRTAEMLAAHGHATFNQHVNIQGAALWSLHHTNLYKLHTVIESDVKAVDAKYTTFGIRTIRFDPNDGFFLDGKRVEIKGECNHADFPAVGIGAPNNLWWWRVMMLKKELHANAYRTSHNPVSPAFYRACDHLGMLVMDENRHPTDSQNAKAKVGDPYNNLSAIKFLILRDRNHPSVIMWSMCNEEFGIQATKYGEKVFRALMHEVHKYDRTRPITCAMNGGYPHGFTHVENLQGINYNPPAYAWMHKLLPNLPIFGSEIGSTCSDRGVLASSKSKGLVSQYTMHPGWAQYAWDTWKPIATQKFVEGGFNWTGFDYRGEPTPYAWPDVNSHFGVLDICGFPKPDAYYYKAWWGKTPLVYICPQWDLPKSMIGKKVLVRCYGNCDMVKLLLNGKKIGEKKMPKYWYLNWQVPYQPGKLVARGYDHGRLVATWTQRTTGPAAGLRLVNQWPAMRANGEDIAPIAVSVVDAHGHVVSNAMNMVHFSISGPGRIVGSGNGDPACLEPNQAHDHQAFYGHCMVLVQAGRHAGVIHVTATAKGLASQTIAITTVAVH
jgi:beta-galactosidase